jgi:broad specificity phosphatase PhoE
MARILLVRHGRSALVHDGSWMNAAGVHDYESRYNAASINDDTPPRDVMDAVAGAQVIAASDMTRAIASARRLAPQRELAISPLLRELELEPPRWVRLKLPIEVWDVFNYAQWSYRLLAGVDHQVTKRAHEAAEWLAAHAAGSSTVLAVTHGGFRRLLDASLVARGWVAMPGRKSYANWSTWAYERDEGIGNRE